MLREEFETWPADPLPNNTFIIVGMHVTNLGFIEDKPPCFTEFLDGGTEESSKMFVELDIAVVIPETNNYSLPDQIDSEAEQTNMKKRKVERR